MKKALKYLLAAFCLAFCLLSRSGQDESAAFPLVRPTPVPSASPAPAPAPTPDPMEAAEELLYLGPWGEEEELSFDAEGGGLYRGLPFEWTRSGRLISLRLLPEGACGRSMTLRLSEKDGRLCLEGAKLSLEPYALISQGALYEKRQAEREKARAGAEIAAGEEISALALSFVGGKYKYGGKSPETGFDCSGLVWYLYDLYGYSLERVANAQADQGREISVEEIRPGDVLAFHTSGDYVGHIGIYVGKGHYVHAMGEAYGIRLTAVDDPYLKRDYEIRRYIGCEELMKNPPAEPLTRPYSKTD